MAEDNVATSRRVLEEVFGEGNVDLIDELCTEDFVMRKAARKRRLPRTTVSE
jgi:hypothetical protein